MSSATTTKWEKFFMEAGCPRRVALQYSQSFVEQRIRETDLQDIDKTTLVELGITTIGDQLAILRHIRRRAKQTMQQQQKQEQLMQMDDVTMEASDDAEGEREVHFLQKSHKKSVSSSTVHKTATSVSSSSSSSLKARSLMAPDRDDIYHIRMPAGITPKTKAIMEKHDRLRSVGLLKRGLSGVRKSGQDMRRYVHHENNKIVIASPEVSSSTVLSGNSSSSSNSQLSERMQRFSADAVADDYLVYERLGVGGLKSDALPQAPRLTLSYQNGDNSNQLQATKTLATTTRMKTSVQQNNRSGELLPTAATPSNEPIFRVRIPTESSRGTGKFVESRALPHQHKQTTRPGAATLRKAITTVNDGSNKSNNTSKHMLLNGHFSRIQKKPRVPVMSRISRIYHPRNATGDIGDVLQKRFLRTQQQNIRQQQQRHFKKSVFDRLG